MRSVDPALQVTSDGSGCTSRSCSCAIDRRAFLGQVGAGVVFLACDPTRSLVAGPFGAEDVKDHHVPADKKLSPDWVRTLTARGERTWYTGDHLKTIGMPVGGICAGQVYLSGDGRLIYWDIFNRNLNTGYGGINYKPGRLPTEVATASGRFENAIDVDQGFAIRVEREGAPWARRLDRAGFANLRFCGEYPIGTVEYRDTGAPVEVTLEAFSPFVPLDSAASSLPATLLHYTVRNTTAAKVRCTLAGWLENKVCADNGSRYLGRARRVNQCVEGPGFTGVFGRTLVAEDPSIPTARPPVVFADFEQSGYLGWTAEGEAFGPGPAGGTLPGQQQVSGFQGQGLVNTYLGGSDRLEGRLLSPEFTIERPWISFLIGGGSHPSRTAMNLLVDGQPVRTATGHDLERLEPANWSVREFLGRKARLEIVDRERSGWGHINVDQIEFRDDPAGPALEDLPRLADYGSMGLAFLGTSKVWTRLALPEPSPVEALLAGAEAPPASTADAAMDHRLRGGIAVPFELEAGASRPLTFAVTWSFPNTFVGALYLAALRAAEEMGRELGESEFAARCRTVFESGGRLTLERLFNGEYFIQHVDLKAHPEWQYADGCLADQLFGQGWAHQVGLGHLYPRQAVLQALASIWKYCWAPDVGPQNAAHKPERWFAYPGEAGLFTCTWSRSRHLGPQSTRYRDEIWTGIEYQVANHMAWEGMVTQALALCRAIHERYHPAKRNPWNEIECGDHYARAMASWSVLLSLAGFEYHGPNGRIGFAPRLAPDDFRCAFTAAEGWGSFSQKRTDTQQQCDLRLLHGQLRLGEVRLGLPATARLTGTRVSLDGAPLTAAATQDESGVRLLLTPVQVLKAGQRLSLVLSTAA